MKVNFTATFPTNATPAEKMPMGSHEAPAEDNAEEKAADGTTRNGRLFGALLRQRQTEDFPHSSLPFSSFFVSSKVTQQMFIRVTFKLKLNMALKIF